MLERETSVKDEQWVGVWEKWGCSTSSEGHSVSAFVLPLFWSVPVVNAQVLALKET